jgi:voltage-gated potassium channel
VIIYAASLAILDVERSQPDHAKITTFGDALWRSITTVTTVAYGELVPVTGRGRLVAVSLMIGGISLVGVVIEELRAEIRHLAKSDTEAVEPAYGEARD